ncbi:hypothetical protein ROZALSC1DRAFT_29293 [Rozella allomycis CSF55]|uniref:UBA domain-containing protein n=1 Tax=Rozella allomycis (strain CSF55) TaxID=988480 RepID=A0A075B0R9_ROZAC|nr:Protein of unknown function DUF2362 domain-containing protein [Rozella allomycis CSF55]RKP19073.1 hypothetical protein ROZALSC1DRAFT_29293 [Rozella allomycis CSF55]|eukprot:EPZ34421.1 Protein of unknown function DUF2362 domain-containing protein [Rozella allomycis CSF55]
MSDFDHLPVLLATLFPEEKELAIQIETCISKYERHPPSLSRSISAILLSPPDYDKFHAVIGSEQLKNLIKMDIEMREKSRELFLPFKRQMDNTIKRIKILNSSWALPLDLQNKEDIELLYARWISQAEDLWLKQKSEYWKNVEKWISGNYSPHNEDNQDRNDDFQKIHSMGFDDHMIKIALDEAQGNVNDALEILLRTQQKASKISLGSPNTESELINSNGPISESFTIRIGTHVKILMNLRLQTGSLTENDKSEDIYATRLETLTQLYSNKIHAAILFVNAENVKTYHRGYSENQEIISQCLESTEHHFDSFDKQIQAAIKMRKGTDIKEGDFFITRHSNLPKIHVLFHLVTNSTQAVDLNSRSLLISNLKSILRVCHRNEINTVSLPLLWDPSITDYNFQSFIKRVDTVIKGIKSYLTENIVQLRINADKNKQTTVHNTIHLLLPTKYAHYFSEVRSLILQTFKTL